MTETSNTLPIEIRNRWTNEILYTGRSGETLKQTVERASLVGACLDGACLYGASLSGASLSGACLSGACLDGASLVGASLDGASLVGASLVGASLSGACLDGANLVGASLVGASLVGACLVGGKIISTASVTFTGHGERGRTLLGIKTDKGIHLRCGCFSGSPDDLIAYIKIGESKYKHTRSLALALVVILLDAENEK